MIVALVSAHFARGKGNTDLNARILSSHTERARETPFNRLVQLGLSWAKNGHVLTSNS